MKKVLLIGTVILLSFPLLASSFQIDGMVRSKAAYRFSQQDLPVQEILVDSTITHFGDIGALSIHPVAYLKPDKNVEFDLKEVYADLYFDNIDLRIGKQTIIWGEAEGAFITDLVSPRDMRSFILADFTEIRKAVPAIKGDFYFGNYTLEGIWVSHHIPSTLPDKDSMWAREPTLFPSPPTIKSPEPFSSAMKHSEFFLSLGHWGGNLNWTINGGTMYSDEPVIASMTPPLTLSQAYERYSFVGGSMNTVIGLGVLRLEAALAFDKPMNKIVLGSPPLVSVETHPQLQVLVGFDWPMFGSQWSAQYLVTYTHDHHDALYSQMRPIQEVEQTVTLRWQKTYLDELLTAKVFSYLELSPLNMLLRPSISYALGSGVILEGGFEFFLGKEEGTFGAYFDNSMMWAALRWYF